MRARFPSSASFETKHIPPARLSAPVSWPRIVPKQPRLCDINQVTVSRQFPKSDPFSDCASRMLFLSNTTATMLALVVEQRRRMMGKASVALVVRKGFVYRSEHTLGRRDYSSFLSRRRDLQTAASSTRVVLPALDRHRSPRAPLICPENAALSSRRRRCVSQLRPWGVWRWPSAGER